MKVLYVDHPEADFLSAQIYAGLCEELGAENVIDYPCKWSFHGRTHTYPSIYETHPGDSPWQSWADRMGQTAPFKWMRVTPAQDWTKERVIEALKGGEFGLVILAAPRVNAVAALLGLVDAVGRETLGCLVIVDGEDYDAIRWDLVEQFGPSVYFKRELVESPQVIYPAQRERMRGRVPVVPLPLAPTRVISDPRELVFDVSLLGGDNSPRIDELRAAVRQVTDNWVIGHLPYTAYTNVLRLSRIVVAPQGHSQDSLRSWEALAVAGPLVMIRRHTLIRPHPFVDGLHCAEFTDAADLEGLLRMYLADEARRLQIAEAGHAHLKAHHTPRERAKYLLETSR